MRSLHKIVNSVGIKFRLTLRQFEAVFVEKLVTVLQRNRIPRELDHYNRAPELLSRETGYR